VSARGRSYHWPDQEVEVHVKGAHLRGAEVMAVKMANGGYRNVGRGVGPTGSGLVLVVDVATGYPRAVLLDNGAVPGVAVPAAAPPPTEPAGSHGDGVGRRAMRVLGWLLARATGRVCQPAGVAPPPPPPRARAGVSGAGYLTDLRTAAAGALAASLLCAPRPPPAAAANGSGGGTMAILGVGVQAQLHARSVTQAMVREPPPRDADEGDSDGNGGGGWAERPLPTSLPTYLPACLPACLPASIGAWTGLG
jgi:hypothetical protein